MLEACHERVERSLALLERLQRHVQTHGCDLQARQAATDVLRYFDMAAPLHHQDEELHVFPALLSGADAIVAQVASTLIAQHRQMEPLWAAMRVALSAIVATDTAPPTQTVPSECLPDRMVKEFCEVYREHIQLEERIAYPHAKDLMDSENLQCMGEDMMQRRGVKLVVPLKASTH